MRDISSAELARVFTFSELVETLRTAFQRPIAVPVRHHHSIPIHSEPSATLLLMPAWHDRTPQQPGATPFMGVKVVSIFPGNSARRKPSVSGVYILMAGETGEPLAAFDGGALTLWRTAAASALAASYLARQDASRLLMVGAGSLAPFLIEAHATVRRITEVLIWNHRRERAEQLAAALGGKNYSVRAVYDLEGGARHADVISCATLSLHPLVRGEWLKPGAHLDLVGAFTPGMRESDDACVRRARIYVDTRAGALSEAGDIVQPIRAGVFGEEDIRGDLFDLCRGSAEGRGSAEEITLFKSVGTAIEDLAAAELAYSRIVRSGSAPPTEPGCEVQQQAR